MNKKEFEKKFLEAYKKAKKLGFEDYFIGVNNNIMVKWKDVKTMIDFKINIPKKQRENIDLNLNMFFQSQKNKEIYLKAVKQMEKKKK